MDHSKPPASECCLVSSGDQRAEQGSVGKEKEEAPPEGEAGGKEGSGDRSWVMLPLQGAQLPG